MTSQEKRDTFSKALLNDVAPEELSLHDTYSAALATSDGNAKAGLGFGIPTSMAGVLSIAAVLAGRLIYDLLADWAKDVAGDILKKYVVETGVDKLKEWLNGPAEKNLEGVLTAEGRLAVLAIVDKDAEAAGLSEEDVRKLKNAVLKRLGDL